MFKLNDYNGNSTIFYSEYAILKVMDALFAQIPRLLTKKNIFLKFFFNKFPNYVFI